MAAITTADVRTFIVERQAATHTTSRACVRRLADGRTISIPERARAISGLLHKPYIPLLREDNTRTGFFDADQFRSVLQHLPAPLQPVIEFAYITGWRIVSEVLPLQWHQIDFDGDEVRLEAGTTKNGEGRVFPLTDDLRALLEAQFEAHQRLKAKGEICPWVFFRMVAHQRGGAKHPKRIAAFNKVWDNA